MHLGTGVIQRRNTQKDIVLGLVMMILLYLAGVHQAFVVVKNCFRETSRTGGEINGSVVLICQRYSGGDAGTVGGQLVIVLCKRGAVAADIKEDSLLADRFCNGFNSSDKFRTKHQYIGFCKVQTIFDFFRTVPEIHGHCQSTGFQRAEINGQPLQTVHQQNCHLVALFHAAAHEQLCKTVCLFVKDMPCDFPTIPERRGRLNQVVVLPEHPSCFLYLRIYFYQCHIIAVLSGVSSNNSVIGIFVTPVLILYGFRYMHSQ